MSVTTATPRAARTAEALLDAAERLFEARGLDDVSVAEIVEAAGQRNAAAVHYHFGGREGLLDAIVERNHRTLDASRAELLAELDAPGRVSSLPDLVSVIVRPMVDLLDSVSGRAFLRIQAQRFSREGGSERPLASSMGEVIERLAPVVPDAPPAWSAERRLLSSLLVNARLAHEVASPGPVGDRETLESALVDAVAAVLSTDPAGGAGSAA